VLASWLPKRLVFLEPGWPTKSTCSSNQDASATDSLDLLFCPPREELGLHNQGDARQTTLAKDFEEARTGDIDNGGFVLVLGVVLLRLLGDQSPQFVDVYSWAEGVVGLLVVLAHTDLTKVTRVESVEQCAVMVLTASHTTATRVFTVLSDTTVPSASVTAGLAVLLLMGNHFSLSQKEEK